MNKKQTNEIIDWLKDAHAMEMSLLKNLEGKSKDAENDEDMETKEKIDRHIIETKNHAAMVESCIKRLGGKTSEGKDTIGKVMGYVQGIMNSMYKDTMVKNAIESYASEHFEIAAYTSIMEAARLIGDQETVGICKNIIADEKKTADWLLEEIPRATMNHLDMVQEEQQ